MDVLGVGMYGIGVHTHPPTSVVLGVPLIPVPYGWWLGFWVVASLFALAGTLRLLDVSAWLAYPIALGLALTGPGGEALVTTYPLSALGIAIAWRFRDRTVAGGMAMGLLSAERGILGLLLLYSAARRRWRQVALAVSLVAVLTLVAVAFEPGVISGFLTDGLASVQQNVSRPETYTLQAIAERRGLPSWPI